MSAVELANPKINIKNLVLPDLMKYVKEDEYDQKLKDDSFLYFLENTHLYIDSQEKMSADKIKAFAAVKSAYPDLYVKNILKSLFKLNNFKQSVLSSIPQPEKYNDKFKKIVNLDYLEIAPLSKLLIGEKALKKYNSPEKIDRFSEINSSHNYIRKGQSIKFLKSQFALKILYPDYKSDYLNEHKNYIFNYLSDSLLDSKLYFVNGMGSGTALENLEIMAFSKFLFPKECSRHDTFIEPMLDIIKRQCLNSAYIESNLMHKFYIKFLEANEIKYNNNELIFDNYIVNEKITNLNPLPEEKNFI